MSGFNAKTLQVLRQAGWHPNRRTDIAAIAARSAACGYEIGENVRAFVREFDGLSVGYPNGNFLFEFRARSEYCSREWFLEIANMIGENGLVVGSTPAVFLIVAESGRMYGYCDDIGETYLVGACMDEGVEFVCRRGNPFKHPL